ncbi:hypothetical protein STANM309S_01407 [Streptomyces tanashiensis]
MQDARDSALSIVKGHRVSELMSIGEEIYDEYMADRIWPGTRGLAQAHLDAGQKVWLVTAAPVETATIIARRLGLTGALGTVAESVGGVYTGKLVGEPLHGPAKAEAVRALAAAEGLDLSRCAAYSDSHNDIPMLSLVATRTRSTRTPSSASTRRTGTGGCATTGPAARPRRSASPPPRASARWPAARPPRSPCTAAATDADAPREGHAPGAPPPCRYVSAAIICDNPDQARSPVRGRTAPHRSTPRHSGLLTAAAPITRPLCT